MAVQNQTPFNLYTANGVTSVFPYGFLLLKNEDLRVSVDGVEKVEGVDYTVDGIGVPSGGNVEWIGTPPADGSAVLLLRAVVPERLTDYQQLGDFFAATVNRDFDRVWTAIQDSILQIGRAIRLPIADPSPTEITLSPSERALKVVGFDADGNLVVTESPTADVSVAAAIAVQLPPAISAQVPPAVATAVAAQVPPAVAAQVTLQVQPLVNQAGASATAAQGSELAALGYSNSAAASYAAARSLVEFTPTPGFPTIDAAVTGPLTATYANGSAGVGATLTGAGALGPQDGVTLSVGQRLLVDKQALKFQNGWYQLTTASPYVLTRDTAADTPAELAGSTQKIAAGGTTRGGSYARCQQDATLVIGTSDITFAELPGAVAQEAARAMAAEAAITAGFSYISDNAADLRYYTIVGVTPADGTTSVAANTTYMLAARPPKGQPRALRGWIKTLGSGAMDFAIFTRDNYRRIFTEKPGSRISKTFTATGPFTLSAAELVSMGLADGDYIAAIAPTGGARLALSSTGGNGTFTFASSTPPAASTFTYNATQLLALQFDVEELAVARTALSKALVSELDKSATYHAAQVSAFGSASFGSYIYGVGDGSATANRTSFFRHPVPRRCRITQWRARSATTTPQNTQLLRMVWEGDMVAIRETFPSSFELMMGDNIKTPSDFGEIVLNEGEFLGVATGAAIETLTTGFMQNYISVSATPPTIGPQSGNYSLVGFPLMMDYTVEYLDDAATADVNRVLMYRETYGATLPEFWTFTGTWAGSGSGLAPAAGAGDTSIRAARRQTWATEKLLARYYWTPSAATDRIAFGFESNSLTQVNGASNLLILHNGGANTVALPGTFSSAAIPALVPGRPYRIDLLRDQRRNRVTLTDLLLGTQVFVEENNNAAASLTMGSGEFRGSPYIINIAGTSVITGTEVLVDQPKPLMYIAGDSIVNGDSVTLAQRWAGIVQASLGGRVAIGGISGITSADARVKFLSDVRHLKPKFYFWAYGTNDQDAGINTFMSAYNTVRKLCDAYGITLVIATVPPAPSITVTALNAFILSLTGVIIVDFARAITLNNDGLTYVSGNYANTVHPNATGHALEAAAVPIYGPRIFD